MRQRTDLGDSCPIGHPSGRIMFPPVSVAQAKARVVAQMNHLEGNCAIGLDVGYATRCLEEAIDDFYETLIPGTGVRQA